MPGPNSVILAIFLRAAGLGTRMVDFFSLPLEDVSGAQGTVGECAPAVDTNQGAKGMNPLVSDWLQAGFRWLHVVAGVTWIGHLYFFNWVNANFAKTMDGPTKKAVVPQLMPRALYFFRWGAAWTWISGIMLLGLVYYMGGYLFPGDVDGNMMLANLLLLAGFVAVFLYDVVMKSTKGSYAGIAICLAMLAGVYGAMEYVGKFSGRALYIHVGAFLGTTMAMNVWMRIWPAQKKIIAAIRDGNPPDADLVALAGLRSRHNTFMSVPLLFTMISNHHSVATYGASGGPWVKDVVLAAIIAVGFFVTSWIYKKSATEAPTKIS